MSSQAFRYRDKPDVYHKDFSNSVLIKGEHWTIPEERCTISFHKNGVPKKILVININISGIKMKNAIIFISSSGKIKTIASMSKKIIINIATNGTIYIRDRSKKLKKSLQVSIA